MAQDETVISDAVALELEAPELQHTQLKNAVQAEITGINRELKTGRIIATLTIPAYDVTHQYQIGSVTHGFDITVTAEEESLGGRELIPFSEISGVSELSNTGSLTEITLPVRMRGDELLFVVKDGIISETNDMKRTRPSYTDMYTHTERAVSIWKSVITPITLMIIGSLLISLSVSDTVSWLTIPEVLAGIGGAFCANGIINRVTDN